LSKAVGKLFVFSGLSAAFSDGLAKPDLPVREIVGVDIPAILIIIVSVGMGKCSVQVQGC